ncbi:MAG: hypothetical protein H7Y11_10520 [Armatimonadetes bacterium]|nr:hypothetical protein [Anaerolineae bacterium]
MSVVLACAWQPRGELHRLRRYFTRLQSIYDGGIVISLRNGDPDQVAVCAALEELALPYEFYYGWSGRHTCVRLGLTTTATHVHYVDMDRLVRWVELRPDELKQLVERVQMVDSLVIGRTPAAYQTHARTLIETEALPNMVFSQYLGRQMDFAAGSRGLSRRAAELVLSHTSEANSLALDVGWAVLVHRAGMTWDYVEVNGLDWETADRFREIAADSAAQRALAAEEDADIRNWSHRVWVSKEILRGGLEAMLQPIDPAYATAHLPDESLTNER